MSAGRIVVGMSGGVDSSVAALLLREEYFWTLAIVLVHVIGSITMTLLGIVITKGLTTLGAS